MQFRDYIAERESRLTRAIYAVHGAAALRNRDPELVLEIISDETDRCINDLLELSQNMNQRLEERAANGPAADAHSSGG